MSEKVIMRILTPTVVALSLVFGFSSLCAQLPAAQVPSRIALVNGQWFSGTGFEPRTLYSVDGRFTATPPARIDSTLDLAGTWMVPPFGEAHDHNIDGAVEERTRQALRRYVADGVFYVKIQGNYPITDEVRRRLPMNRADGPDVLLAQSFLIATGGHPIQLHEDVLCAETTPQAIFPERRIGVLRDGYEASFLALSGNPLEDSGNVRRIKFRFKQGVLLP